jgi:hypothetical protein
MASKPNLKKDESRHEDVTPNKDNEQRQRNQSADYFPGSTAYQSKGFQNDGYKSQYAQNRPRDITNNVREYRREYVRDISNDVDRHFVAQEVEN